MKKILLILSVFTVFCTCQNVYSFENIEAPEQSIKETPKATEIISPNVEFDWLKLTPEERQAKVNEYKEILFNKDLSSIYLTKEEFTKKFGSYKKDREYKHHYMLTNNGVTEDEDAKYCAFYYKKNTLVVYAIQYKTNPHNAYYYTAYGKLYYVDITSDDYPNFPYYSMQYNRKGKLKSAIYFASKDIQYMYNPDGTFQGIWYKDKMYDQNGNQKLTRTNW